MSARNCAYWLAGLLIAGVLNGCSRENPRVTTKMNVAASLTGSLPWDPLQGNVITSWVDQRNATMSTLFGNGPAIEAARTSTRHSYPSGAILSLVTWHQQEDERWFGAKIPAAPQSVEFVMIEANPDGSTQYRYKQFQGNPLQQTSANDGPTPNERAAYLLAAQAAVMP